LARCQRALPQERLKAAASFKLGLLKVLLPLIRGVTLLKLTAVKGLPHIKALKQSAAPFSGYLPDSE